ncbi:hypothetical protein VTI28DRAFT_1785 [Corynascus sepedonium]
MRLLEFNGTGEICLTRFFVTDVPQYAILSHTWGSEEEEVSFQDLRDVMVLRGSPLSHFSVSERMGWIEKRSTTRKEDKAYSLLGIFGIHMPLIYGEGENNAFRRLREEINKASRVEEVHDLADARCLADLRCTDPRDDKKRIEDEKGGLLRDSYRWVLDNTEFQRWREDKDSRLLWIKGDPGKGKTMLLCGIIEELKKFAPSDLLSFFFCQATDSRINSATAVLRGLIYLVISQQPTLIYHVRKKYDHAGKTLFEDTNAWVALLEIFTNILQDPNLKPTYFIIDALDECVTDRPRLLNMIVQESSVSSRVKWIVSSRNWLDIEEQLETAAQKARLSLELNADSVAAAVTIYIQHQVDQLARKKHYDTATRDTIQDYLSSHANDTFLWVALVCRALANSKVRKRHSLAKLRTFPAGLDALYLQMLEHISHSEVAELCKHILAVVTRVHRPSSLQELSSLVDVPDDISNDLESLEEIIGLCGSFLTIRNRIVYFVHQSAKDFLLGKATDTPSVLRRDMYSLGAPGLSIDSIQVPDPDPLAADQGVVYTFLKTKYLYWLEALSLLRAMSEAVTAIRQLEGLLGCNNGRQLADLVHDAYRFALTYRWIIEQAPLQAYTSALVFAPAGSLIKTCFKAEEPNWISTKPAVEADWGTCIQTLEGHSNLVTSVAFSPHDQRLASGSHDNTIKIWDAMSGHCVQTLEGHNNTVSSVAYSPSGERLASGSVDHTIKIWDASSGSCIRTMRGHNHSVTSVAFSPDSQRLATGSDDNTIKIWNATSGSYVQTLEGHNDTVYSVAFSPDGRRLASGSDDKTIKIWDAMSGQCIQTLEGHNNTVSSVAYSPSGERLASGSVDHTIKIWDASSGSCIRTMRGHNHSVTSVAFSPDSQRLATGSDDNTIKIWNATSGSYVQTLEGHNDTVYSVAFSPDGRRLASGSDDKTIKIWDAMSGQCIQTLEGHNDTIFSVAFSPDGQRLASCSLDNTIKIWDTASGSSIQTLECDSDSVASEPVSVSFSPDGQHLASGMCDKTVRIWNVVSGACIQTLGGHKKSVTSVAFLPDGQRLASGSNDNTIKIWNVTSSTYVQTQDGHSDMVLSVTFSHDGQRLASGSRDKTIKIWDAASGSIIQTLEGHSNSVFLLAFSPHGQRLASCSLGQTIKIWDTTSGSCIQTVVEGHDFRVTSVAFSPDGQRLAFGSHDKTIKIWDAASGHCLRILEGHKDWVKSVAFSSDGQQLASVSYDKTVKIWDAKSGSCVHSFNTGRDITYVSFDHTNCCIFTNTGCVKIGTAAVQNPVEPQHPEQQTYALGQDRSWITCNGQNVLWLPWEYRPECIAIKGRKMGIGCASGRVFAIGFSRDT